ncbi:MAG: DUF3147 family protein [Chloroflexi bacterium]|nr:DUF3147 family protein [Chloroflexota bacterium]
MNGELVLRFVLGGLAVSAFSLLGDVVRPKTLAGVFGAAPSVALATVGIALASRGSEYASLELRSMAFGAIALGCYGFVVGRLLLRGARPTLLVTVAALIVWFGLALGLWALFLHAGGEA